MCVVCTWCVRVCMCGVRVCACLSMYICVVCVSMCICVVCVCVCVRMCERVHSISDTVALPMAHWFTSVLFCYVSVCHINDAHEQVKW